MHTLGDDCKSLFKLLEAVDEKSLSLKVVFTQLNAGRSKLEWREALSNVVAAAHGALLKTDKAVQIVGIVPEIFKSHKETAAALSVTAEPSTHNPAPSSTLQDCKAVIRLLESSKDKSLPLREVYNRLSADRSKEKWREALSNVVACAAGALAKNDKTIGIVGTLPEQLLGTCKERRKAKREAERDRSGEDAGRVGYHLRSHFTCAGCKLELPAERFNKNQIKKGAGKHRCARCVASSETVAATSVAAEGAASPTLTGGGAAIRAKRKRSDEDARLWQSDAQIPKSVLRATLSSSSWLAEENSRTQPCPPPSLQMLRWRKAKALRSLYHRQLNEHSACRFPLMAFERWLARCKLHEAGAETGTREGSEQGVGGGYNSEMAWVEEVLPNTSWVDPGFVRDLERVNISSDAAVVIAENLTRASLAAVKEIEKKAIALKEVCRSSIGVGAGPDGWMIGPSDGSDGSGSQDIGGSDHRHERAAASDDESGNERRVKKAKVKRADDDEDDDDDAEDDENGDEANDGVDAARNAEDAKRLQEYRFQGDGCVTLEEVRGVFRLAHDPTTHTGLSSSPGAGGRDREEASAVLERKKKKPPGSVYLEVKRAHLAKLAALFLRHNKIKTDVLSNGSSSTTTINGGAAAASDDDDDDACLSLTLRSRHAGEFVCRVFAVLSGYEAMSGHGYQAALSGGALRVLKAHLGVCMECFASPLNCFWPHFCSALPSLDAPFGSLGSFFSFRPTSGSFECNPPFVPEVMSAVVQHVEALLECAEQSREKDLPPAATPKKNTKIVFCDDSDDQTGGRSSVDDRKGAEDEHFVGALSFVVVVPHWPAVAAWQALTKSPHRTGGFDVAASEHTYVDGAQHLRGRELLRPSSFGTTVAVLQTRRGAARWPWTEQIESELRSAMAQTEGVPKSSSSKRRGNAQSLDEWEKRGVAKGGRGAAVAKVVHVEGRGGGKGRGKGQGKGRDRGQGTKR